MSLRFATSARTRLTPTQLVALITDLTTWVTMEPRLDSARWTPPTAPHRGATLCVQGRIPYRIPAAAQAFGHPEGDVQLLDWEPPNHARVALRFRHVHGEAWVEVRGVETGAEISVIGWARPNYRPAELALAPLQGVLRHRAERAITRAIGRLDTAGARARPGTSHAEPERPSE